MTKHFEILAAEQELEERKRNYLQRWGWESICSTPGAFWLWRRDFSDEDAKRQVWHDEHPKASPLRPYGIITAPTDIAVSMTVRCLDEQPELGDEP